MRISDGHTLADADEGEDFFFHSVKVDLLEY